MVELEDNVRMGLLVGAAALLIFTIVNTTGLVFGGEKLFLLDLFGIHLGYTDEAIRADPGISPQDIVGFLAAAVMGVLYYLSNEEELDWEALLGDDDDDEEE